MTLSRYVIFGFFQEMVLLVIKGLYNFTGAQ